MRTLILIILIIVFVAVVHHNYLTNVKYHKYSSMDPDLNIIMYYPAEWHYSEHKASYGNYAQVVFYETEREYKDFKASMVVNIKSYLEDLDIETVADELLSERMKFKDAQMLSRAKTKLLDKDVIELNLSYKTLSKLYRQDAKVIPVKERIVVLKKDDKFYTLRYENTEEEFEAFNKMFTHCIRTLRFRQ